MKIYKWRIYCETETAYVYNWASSEPTDCPNDSGHSIDSTKTAIVDSIETEEVTNGLVVEPLDAPSTPTVTPQGTPGSTTWGYKVTAHSSVGETIGSVEGTTSTGAATLGTTDFNRVTWSAIDGAKEYSVYRTTAGGTPSSTGKLATTSNLQLDDTGLSASGSVPSEDRSGAVVIGDGVGASLAERLLVVGELTADYQTVTSLMKLIRRSSGTVGDGFGTGLLVDLEDDSDVQRNAAALHVLWDDASSGSLAGKFRVVLRDGDLPMVSKFEVRESGIWAPNLAAELIESVDVATDVSSVTFSGLSGDDDEVYLIVARILNGESVAKSIYLEPNGVTQNQQSTRLRWTDSTTSVDGVNYLKLGSFGGGSDVMQVDAIFFAKSGQNRTMRSNEVRESGTDGLGSIYSGVWFDTTTVVTSLEISSSSGSAIGAGSKLSLYKMRR